MFTSIKTYRFKKLPVSFWGSVAASLLLLSGCAGQGMINRPSVAELNNKAQALLAQGDTAGAIGRLESARDLDPNQPNTLFNLAIAYQNANQIPKAIPLLEQLLNNKDRPGQTLDSSIEDRVRQTLAVAYEAQADAASQAPLNKDAKEAPSPPSELSAKPLSPDSRALLEKAIAVLQQGSPKLLGQPDIQAHLQQLKTSVAKAQ